MGTQALRISLSVFLMVFIINISLYAQQQSVKGIVTDAKSGNTLPGVNILVKGTSMGTSTDSGGNYSLDVPSKQDTLVVSYVGYATKEVPINGRTTVNIDLKSRALQGEEMVVVGYGTQQKKDLTGSIGSVDIEKFEESPNVNIGQALSGSVAGLQVSKPTRAGEEPSFKIRGRTTLNGDTAPLIVLDGIIYTGRVTDLNPNDIKSIDILKDASSKAIYGAQAANGVILITTKEGKKNQKPTISYSAQYSTQLPAHKLQPLNREGYLKQAKDIAWKDAYLAPDYTEDNPEFDPTLDIPFFPPLINGYKNGTNYNWYNSATDPGLISKHNLTLSGGTSNISYYIGGGYTQDDGWMLNDNYNRITGRINFEADINDWFTIGTNTFGGFADYSGATPSLGALVRASPLVTPRNEDGEYVINPNGQNQLNPFLQSSVDDKDIKNHIMSTVYGKLTVPKIKGLTDRINFSNDYIWSPHFTSNKYGAGLSGSAQKSFPSILNMTLNNITTYDRRFHQDHAVKVTLVFEYRKKNYQQFEARGEQYSDLTLSYNKLGLAGRQFITSGAWREKYLSQSARLNYGFRDRYLLTATIRRDGFSGFAENHKIGLFPSVGLAWRLSEEKPLAGIEALNNLKIRASYGVNGNLTSRYSSLARVSRTPSYVFNGSTALGQYVTSLGNDNLTWETTKALNIGIDFGILENRLEGSFDYYKSTTTDLLYNVALPEITGFSNIRSNLGKIANRGFEISLSSDLIRSQSFNWNMDINFASNHNEIKELLGLDRDDDGKEDDLVASGLFIGQPIGAIYDYEIDSIYQVGENRPSGWEVGSYKLVDQNEDGKITAAEDRKIVGHTEPAYSFSIHNTLSYQNFSLSFLIKSIQGGKNGYLGTPNGEFGDTPGNTQNQNDFAGVDYWSPSNPNATYRRPGLIQPINVNRKMQRNFFRLQDISFAYTFNEKLLQKASIKNLKVYISGKNLLTITNWGGWDPETGQGYDTYGLPVMKGIAAGLDISF